MTKILIKTIFIILLSSQLNAMQFERIEDSEKTALLEYVKDENLKQQLNKHFIESAKSTISLHNISNFEGLRRFTNYIPNIYFSFEENTEPPTNFNKELAYLGNIVELTIEGLSFCAIDLRALFDALTFRGGSSKLETINIWRYKHNRNYPGDWNFSFDDRNIGKALRRLFLAIPTLKEINFDNQLSLTRKTIEQSNTAQPKKEKIIPKSNVSQVKERKAEQLNQDRTTKPKTLHKESVTTKVPCSEKIIPPNNSSQVKERKTEQLNQDCNKSKTLHKESASTQAPCLEDIFKCFEVKDGVDAEFSSVLRAISMKNSKQLKSLVDNGYYSKNYTNIYGANALHFAVFYDFLKEIDRMLAESNLDDDAKISIGDKKYDAIELADYLKKSESRQLLREMYCR